MQAKFDAKAKEITVTFNYDPKATYKLSKSGKNMLPATTGGFTLRVPGTDVSISLNAMAPKGDDA